MSLRDSHQTWLMLTPRQDGGSVLVTPSAVALELSTKVRSPQRTGAAQRADRCRLRYGELRGRRSTGERYIGRRRWATRAVPERGKCGTRPRSRVDRRRQG